MVKKPFWFEITYFKPSGKFYASEVVKWEIRGCDGAGAPDEPYLPDAVAKLRGLRDTGGPGAMPGLHPQTEGWEGTILIQQCKPWPNVSPAMAEKMRVDDFYVDGVPHVLVSVRKGEDDE